MKSSSGSSRPEAGVLLCDKPAGVTSHDEVAALRRELGGVGGSGRSRPKVGHAGTLDPFATGLLLMLVGPATRLQRYLMGLPKTYLATARLGWLSSTGDSDGELEPTGRVPEDPRIATGRQLQRVPMTSAVRVEGERLYRRAHRGEQVATPEREVTVYEARRLELDRERARFEITCSSGTYVRTLIEGLGDAYCEQLRRTSIGSLELLPGRRAEVSPARTLEHLPARRLDDAELNRVATGAPVRAGELAPPPRRARPPSARFLPEDAGLAEPGAEGNGRPAVRLLAAGKLVAVARLEGGELRPEAVLV